jgi:hypothetical protein
MKRHGVILLDETEIIFRIYETTDHEWKLFHYHSSVIKPTFDAGKILEIIADFFGTEYAQSITEWKMCSRYFPKKILRDLSQALDISVENLSLHREQELICKGMFTELW